MATSKLHRDVVLEHNAQSTPPVLSGKTGAFWVGEGAEPADPTLPEFTDSDGESHQLAYAEDAGDVVGPNGAGDHVIARFDGETGKVIQGGTTAPSYDDNGNLSVNYGNSLRIWETDGTHFLGFSAPTLAATAVWVLPPADGTAGQALVTDGDGNLSFASVGAGSGVTDHGALTGLNDVADHPGYLVTSGTRTASYIRFGTNYATEGYVRLPHGGAVYSRNYYNTANRLLLGLSGDGDYLSVGDSGVVTVVVRSSSAVSLLTSAGMAQLSDDGVTMGFNVSSVPPGLAGSGKFRFFRYHSTLCCATETGRFTVAPARLS